MGQKATPVGDASPPLTFSFELPYLPASVHIFAVMPAVQLEAHTRFSDSHWFKAQRSWYDTKGVGAWCDGLVPSYITCNTYISSGYAQTMAAFFRENEDKPGMKTNDEP